MYENNFEFKSENNYNFQLRNLGVGPAGKIWSDIRTWPKRPLIWHFNSPRQAGFVSSQKYNDVHVLMRKITDVVEGNAVMPIGSVKYT